MKKIKLRPWVKYTLFIILLVLIISGLLKLLDNNEEEHIESMSQECASQGYGIKANYTKSGDKYYVCNK